MSSDLSYPFLRTVLEYLDPHKRIHIAARSPALHLFNKSIPIHFDYLAVEIDGFRTNQINSKVEFWDMEQPRSLFGNDDLQISQGDFQFRAKNATRKREFTRILFESNGFRWIRHLPYRLELHVASRILARSLLGYRKVFANCLEFRPMGFSVLRLPENVKFSPKNLNINNNDFEDCLQLLDTSSSFETLKITITDAQSLLHPKIKSVETLVIQNVEADVGFLGVANVSNKHVEMNNIEPQIRDIVNVLEMWQQGIGSSFALKTPGEWFVRDVLAEVEEKFEGEYRMLEIRAHKIPYCVTFQQSATSELNIYGVEENNNFMLKIEANPIGTSLPFPTQPEPRAPVSSIIPMLIEGLKKQPDLVQFFIIMILFFAALFSRFLFLWFSK